MGRLTRGPALLGASLVGTLALAVPALALGVTGTDGQPPPGAPAAPVDPQDVAPVPSQPAAGAPAAKVGPSGVASVPAQPQQERVGPAPASAQVSGPHEVPGPVRDHGGRVDGGGEGGDAPGGRAD
jgi:hypothetical protein